MGREVALRAPRGHGQSGAEHIKYAYPTGFACYLVGSWVLVMSCCSRMPWAGIDAGRLISMNTPLHSHVHRYAKTTPSHPPAW